MPKVGRMTAEERRAAAFKKEIMALCKHSKYGSLRAVMDEVGESYISTIQLLTKGRIRAQTVGKIFKLTGADDKTILKLMRM